MLFFASLTRGEHIVPYAHGFWAHRVACFLRNCRVPRIAGYARGGCRGRRPCGENARSMLALGSYFPTNAMSGQTIDGDPARHGIRREV